MIEPDYVEQVLEACDGALLFASSCILGYQVYDGYVVAQGGARALPEAADRLGRLVPERHARDVPRGRHRRRGRPRPGRAHLPRGRAGARQRRRPGRRRRASRCGATARVVYTAHRAVVGFDQFQPVPWHLLEFERYAELQTTPTQLKVRHRFPLPGHWTPRAIRRAASATSRASAAPSRAPSAARRWSPAGAGRRSRASSWPRRSPSCSERFEFDVLRFQDANFGVAEKRTREFCEGLVERERADPLERHDRDRDDHALQGGDARPARGVAAATCSGSAPRPAPREMQERIKKHIEIEHIPERDRRARRAATSSRARSGSSATRARRASR